MPLGASGTGIQGKVDNTVSRETQIYDAEATFLSDNIRIGSTIVNLTDGSQTTVIGIIDDNNLLTDYLTGGTDDTWSQNDTYRIYIDDVNVSTSLLVQWSQATTYEFSCRVINVEYHARNREYYIQRHGVKALYKNAYASNIVEPYSETADINQDPYTIKNTGTGPTNEYLEDNDVINMELLFGPTEERTFVYLNPNEISKQTPYGIVSTGTAVLGASLYHPYRKGDLIKIHDKIWQISEIPTFEFLRNREIIGYRLVVTQAGSKHQQVDW